MAEHQLKKLQYDNKDIVAEVANRDSSGNVISTTYVDKSNNQEISGQKDFNAIPRVWVNPVVVPTGYTQIDYIELSGTQYINTGIIANSNTYVEIDFDNTDIANNGAAIGARANVSDFGTYVIWSCIAASSKIRFDYGGNNVFQTDTIQSGVKYSVVKNGVLNYINGAAQASNTPRTYTGTYPLWIGCINQAEEITFPLIGKIYSCKIAQNNGATISRNFIPCIRKSDSVVGLYDLVSETFFTNDGTGSFTPGPESIGHYETLLTSGNIPTKTSDLANDSGFITSAYHDSTKANQSSVDAINAKIPNAATSSNQLADKAFVNSSIASNTGVFKGTFNNVSDLPTTDVHNNDYAFVVGTDVQGNTVYNRYKYNGTNWIFEYALNNSSFTAVQWSAINSGATTTNIAQIATNTSAISGIKNGTNINDFSSVESVLSGKQNTINSSNKLSASLVSGLSNVATSGDYNDLTNKPTIPNKTSDLTNDSGFITNAYHDNTKQNDLTNLASYDKARYLHANNITGNLEWIATTSGLALYKHKLSFSGDTEEYQSGFNVIIDEIITDSATPITWVNYYNNLVADYEEVDVDKIVITPKASGYGREMSYGYIEKIFFTSGTVVDFYINTGTTHETKTYTYNLENINFYDEVEEIGG